MRLLGGLVLAACLWPTSVGAQSGPNVAARVVTAPAEIVAGGTFQLEATIRVEGGVSSVGWTAYLAPNGVIAGARELGPFPAVALTGAQFQFLSQTVTVPPGAEGVYQIAVVLDPANSVSEVNEFDNLQIAEAVTRVRSQSADLSVTAATADAGQGRPDDAVSVDVVVANGGELAASTDVTVYLSRDGEVSTADAPIGTAPVTVGPGGTAAVQVAGRVPASLRAGTYTLGAIVDPLDTTPERTEVDNVFVADPPFTVFFDTLTLETADLPPATLTIPYSVTLRSSGGDGAYAYRVASGAVPDGLTLTAGVLAGTPAASGTFDFEIEVESDGKTDRRAYQVTVALTDQPLVLVSRELGDGFLNMPYEQALIAGGGEAPYVFDLTSGVLPPGLDLTPAGLVTGIPIRLGTFNFEVEVRDQQDSRDVVPYEVTVTSATNVIVLTLATEPLPVGEPADVQLEAAGGATPYDWRALTAAPPGLALGEDGRLTGVPLRVGRWPMLVEVADRSRTRFRDSALVLVDVVDAGDFSIVLDQLPEAQTRRRYEVLLEAEGGQPPLRWGLAPGSGLPEDFFLQNGDGEEAPEDTALLYGVPGLEDTYAITIRVVDAYGRVRDQTYALTVSRVTGAATSGCRAGGSGGIAPVGLAVLGLLGALRRRRRRPLP